MGINLILIYIALSPNWFRAPDWLDAQWFYLSATLISSTINQEVVGSSPTGAAIINRQYNRKQGAILMGNHKRVSQVTTVRRVQIHPIFYLSIQEQNKLRLIKCGGRIKYRIQRNLTQDKLWCYLWLVRRSSQCVKPH